MHVKDGIRAAGGTPMEFNTVSISDGITMGTEGMRASLVSREVIADSIELVARGNGFDGLVVLVGCDKTIPGGVDGAGAAEHPGPACSTAARSRRATFHGQRRHDSGRVRGGRRARGRHDERRRLLHDSKIAACPGAGACGGQFTANTMAIGERVPRHRRRSAAAACRRPTRRRPTSRARPASA